MFLFRLATILYLRTRNLPKPPRTRTNAFHNYDILDRLLMHSTHKYLAKVRQAVVDAKKEIEQSSSSSGGSTGRDSGDDGMGLSGFFSLVMLSAGLGGLWAYLSAFPNGTLARFLIGFFPREMETLGLIPQ